MARPRKPSLDRLRTLVWYEAVKQAVATEEAVAVEDVTAYRIGRVLRLKGVRSSEESRQWYYYEQADRVCRVLGSTGISSVGESRRRWDYEGGSHCPSDVTLKAVDRLYPGTRMIFDKGPHFSYLWDALGGDPERAAMQIVATWRQGVPLQHQILREGKRYTEDVVVPERLAKRWNVRGNDALDLIGKCQPWEGFEDVCAKAAWPEFFNSETCADEEVLPFAPSLTLPFLAGLSYRVALSRIRGENHTILDIIKHESMTEFSGRLLFHVQFHLWLKQPFRIQYRLGEGIRDP